MKFSADLNDKTGKIKPITVAQVGLLLYKELGDNPRRDKACNISKDIEGEVTFIMLVMRKS